MTLEHGFIYRATDDALQGDSSGTPHEFGPENETSVPLWQQIDQLLTQGGIVHIHTRNSKKGAVEEITFYPGHTQGYLETMQSVIDLNGSDVFYSGRPEMYVTESDEYIHLPAYSLLEEGNLDEPETAARNRALQAVIKLTNTALVGFDAWTIPADTLERLYSILIQPSDVFTSILVFGEIKSFIHFNRPRVSKVQMVFAQLLELYPQEQQAIVAQRLEILKKMQLVFDNKGMLSIPFHGRYNFFSNPHFTSLYVTAQRAFPFSNIQQGDEVTNLRLIGFYYKIIQAERQTAERDTVEKHRKPVREDIMLLLIQKGLPFEHITRITGHEKEVTELRIKYFAEHQEQQENPLTLTTAQQKTLRQFLVENPEITVDEFEGFIRSLTDG